MSSIKKKELGIGIFLMVTFIAVMVGIFMPLFDGGNALDYLDNLYNSISKGSAYTFRRSNTRSRITAARSLRSTSRWRTREPHERPNRCSPTPDRRPRSRAVT